MNRLNSAQQEAVVQTDGPMLVIAGPGTGKTETLAARIGEILSAPGLHANPNNILCLTFTESGAITMRRRLVSLIGPDAHRIRIHTFHSFCNDIIQTYPQQFGMNELRVASELEKIQAVHRLIDDLPGDSVLKKTKGDVYSDTGPLINLFSLMKREGWDTGYIAAAAEKYLASLPEREGYRYKKKTKDSNPGDLNVKKIKEDEAKMGRLMEGARLFPLYRKLMRDQNRYDFDDMILWVLEAFREDPEFLIRHQEQINYVLVDEYQDTNGAQNELLMQLISYWDKPDVFVVGDDDQSIFRFQGANVKNITDFYEKYKPYVASPVVLTENYRSSQHILDAANALISNNHERLTRTIGISKKLAARHPSYAGSSLLPKVVRYQNTFHEDAGVIGRIEQIISSGGSPGDIAVIYSKHALAENLIRGLDRKKIPYNLVRKVNAINAPVIVNLEKILQYAERERKRPGSADDLLFELMHFDFFNLDPNDIALLSLTNGAKKFYDQGIRRILSNPLELQAIGLKEPAAFNKVFEKLNGWIRDSFNLTIQELVQKIMAQSGLLDRVLNAPDRIWQLEVVNAFFRFLREEHAKNPRMDTRILLEMIDLLRDYKLEVPAEQVLKDPNAVTLVTAHSAKGLEFKHVFIIGCTDDNWERSRGNYNQFSYPDTLILSNAGDPVEESRRLFYVAMTRAMEELVLSYPEFSNMEETVRTKFIDEIPAPLYAEETAVVDRDAMTAYMTEQVKPQPEVTLYPYEESIIDEGLKNFKLNATGLNQYLDCPVAYFYERVLNVPRAKNEYAAFGTAVHNTMRDVFNKMKEDKDTFPPLDQVTGLFDKYLLNELDGFTEKKFISYKQFGHRVLGNYYSKYVGTWPKITVTEYSIKAVVDGVPLNGRLDKLEFNDRNVTVVDYKTGGVENGIKKMQPPGVRNPLGGDYWRQIIFYKILMDADMKNPDWNMVRGVMDYIEPDEKDNLVIKEVTFKAQDIEMVRRQIKDTYTKIMMKQFSPGCGRSDCDWCKFEKERTMAAFPLKAAPEIE